MEQNGDDEIDLFELSNRVWARRMLVGTTTVVCLTIAVIYVLIASPIFQSKIEVVVGSASDGKQLVSDVNLLTFADANVTAELPRPKPGVTPNVKVSVTSPDKGATIRVINEVATQIVGSHKEIIDSKLLAADKSSVEMQDALDRINALDGADVNRTVAMYERDRLAKETSPYSYKYTSIVNERDLEKATQIKPRKTATIVIGAIAGLVFGVFLALLLDAIKDFREKRKRVAA